LNSVCLSTRGIIEKLSIHIQKPLILIEEVSEQVNQVFQSLEPRNIPIKPENYGTLLENDFRKQGWWDSNLFEGMSVQKME